MTARRVAKSYKDKGAAVIPLDLGKIERYDEPQILLRAGKRIGLFSVSGSYKESSQELNRKARYLKRHEVDMVVLIADHRSMLNKKLHGVNVALLAGKAKVLPGGEFRGRTYCVSSPYEGQVGVVIISPSKVVTARTIEEK